MSISKKITIPILLTVVGGVVAYLAFYEFLARTRFDTAVIELAGMQAVRAEQIGRLAHARAEGYEWAREPLASVIADFDRGLRALNRDSGEEDSLLAPPTPELEATVESVARTWSSVEDLATQIAQRPPADPSIAGLYLEMRPLLPELNEATVTLIKESRDRIERVRNRMLSLLGLICVLDFVLMFAALGLMARVVVKPLKTLENAALRFKDGRLAHRLPVGSRDEIGRVSMAFNDMSTSIETLLEREKSATASLRVLSEKLLTAQHEERRRIARELHDSTLQTIAAATIRIDQVLDAVQTGKRNPAEEAELARKLLTEAMDEIRTLSYTLHPPALEKRGFVPALRDFVKGFSTRSGVEVHLEVAAELEEARLPDAVALTLFRVAQEALMNVARHAASDEVTVRVDSGQEASRGYVAVQIAHTGRGIPRERLEALSHGEGEFAGVGIASMRERVEILGGRFVLTSSPGGTRVTARLWIDTEAQPLSNPSGNGAD